MLVELAIPVFRLFDSTRAAWTFWDAKADARILTGQYADTIAIGY